MTTLTSTPLTQAPYAFLAPLLFGIAYGLVIAEEFIQLRKSKPMMICAGVLWILVAFLAQNYHASDTILTSLNHYLLEYGQLLLFIIVAMTYISIIEEYQVFQSLKVKLLQKRCTYRQLFWITGILTFFISAIADNLTTAIAFSAVLLAFVKDHKESDKEQKQFLTLASINVVVAANAGGVFSPFGDITTLMVWQAGILPFGKFFHLCGPALINFVIPAVGMHFFLPKGGPKIENQDMLWRPGATSVISLFLLTITITVLVHHYFHLPPVIGMMFGLGLLQVFAYYSRFNRRVETFDIFPSLQRMEWDTLLFFYGVILSVGALSTIGYLASLSHYLYSDNGTTWANIIIGILSAIVDNIPVMFAVISMKPTMSEGQWLLITLTTGIGGSLLAIGSAAGVALLGQAKGSYTFFSHLRWSWIILIAYFASVGFHLWWNANLF